MIAYFFSCLLGVFIMFGLPALWAVWGQRPAPRSTSPDVCGFCHGLHGWHAEGCGWLDRRDLPIGWMDR